MILTLEQQVCTLESAKLLKDLGVKQESLFYWFHYHVIHSGGYVESSEPSLYSIWEMKEQDRDGKFVYSAYNVAEFGEMLPECIVSRKTGDSYQIKAWIENEVLDRGIMKHLLSHDCNICGKTEAEARAKALIYLIQEGLLKP